jgi:MATE family multidrug resistance protein
MALGLPAAAQITLEVGVFAAATTLAGQLDPVALASHQIALNVISFLFMVPLGIASSAAVRVGHAVGRRDADGAGRAGWSAIALTLAFMSGSALVLWTMPATLIRAFTSDAAVLALASRLLALAALFQLFDGLQVVTTGNLRGLGDTRTPVLWNISALGARLPIALAVLPMQWGVVGLWVGLATA